MAKIGTESVYVREDNFSRENGQFISFKYSIDVSTKGVFSTMLPADVIEKFKQSNIELHKNRVDKEGYLCANTFDELKKRVESLCQEYLSRELISETIILKYGIKTQASYCVSTEGEIVPNAQSQWIKGERTPATDWRNGTVTQHASSPLPFGIMVYVKPYFKQVYKYASGQLKEELSPVYDSFPDKENQPNLHWLTAICSMSPKDLSIQEIPYTEEVAAVFVNMVKAICSVNERVKDFTSPEHILYLAQNNQKLLG